MDHNETTYSFVVDGDEQTKWRWRVLNNDGEVWLSGVEASQNTALRNAQFSAAAATMLTRARARLI